MKEITKIESSTDTYKINKNLKLNTVNEGEPTDNVLVHGSDNEVKSIPRSEFGGGSQTLDQTLTNGNKTTKEVLFHHQTKKDYTSIDNSGFFASNGETESVGVISSFLSKDDLQIFKMSLREFSMLDMRPADIGFINNRSGGIRIKPISTITTDLEQLLPNKSGTFALLSDIIAGGNQNLDEVLSIGNISNKNIVLKGGVGFNAADASGKVLASLSTDRTEGQIKVGVLYGTDFSYSSIRQNTSSAIGTFSFLMPVSRPDSEERTLATEDQINLESVLADNAKNTATNKSIRLQGNYGASQEANISPSNIDMIDFTQTAKTARISPSVVFVNDGNLTTSIFSDKINFDQRNKSFSLKSATLTASRTQTLQDRDGVVALLSDIPARMVENVSTTALTSTILNTTYPDATLGFKVITPSISGGGLIYEKMSSAWIQYAVTVVP